jgi:dimethylaniline monooxygenase (N-oxide forming)|tara:strand:+ start:1389 stop:2693 length:1305 start_codon:yes stop_codon:yes gene_type:complete
MNSKIERIAIIGAGAAGICAAKHMLGLRKDVVVFEKGSFIGGLWVYQNDNGRSPAYKSLHINSEARVTGYRDFPLPKDSGFFPSHFKIRKYLENYASHFDVCRHIRFKSEVTSIEPVMETGNRNWLIRVPGGTSELFDRVIVANGHQAEAIHPPYAKDFGGKYLHSLHYRTPDAFNDKKVLVIGTGNSGLDIAADVSTVTKSTTVSARSPVLIMPRMFLGVPLSRFLAKVERHWLPWPVRRRMREFVTWLVHGSMENWGLVAPKIATHPASHPTIFSHMAWGRIFVKPGIKSVRGNDVEFTDGSVEAFDAMIAATGYRIDFPFFSDDLSPIKDHHINLYRRVVHPNHLGLYFVGLFDVSGGANIRMMDIQCRWLTALIAGHVKLPPAVDMINEYEADQQRLADMYPATPRYGLELDPREYGLTLREDLKLGNSK